MANILQVNSPSIDTNSKAISDSQRAADYDNSQRIRNPVDPSRVVRADGQEQKETGDSTGEKRYGIIDYESNYGAFIKKAENGIVLPTLIEQLFSDEEAAALFAGQIEAGELVKQMISSVRLTSPGELLAFLKEQQASQAKFSGSFFDSLRTILTQSPSGSLKEAVLDFLKTYNDYSSGGHFLHQMHSLTDDIEGLLFRQYRDEFRLITDGMEWQAPDGDTAANTSLLNNRLIPFLSNYVSRSHDYGAVRDTVMLLVFHAVRYENGSLDRLRQMFDRMVNCRGFEQFCKEESQPDMAEVLRGLAHQEGGFADAFASLVLKGAGGQAGTHNIQQFYQILNGMLLNESVYLPLLHILAPFQYQGKEVMSEIWADPDAKREKDEGRKIKMLFKINIGELGKFDMVVSYQDRRVDMKLHIPPVLAGRHGDIRDAVTEIFTNNGLLLNSLRVRERSENTRLEDVFTEIGDRERSINVRI